MSEPCMELDVLGLLGACSYALDCVEAELTHVTTNHAKRVAYMSVCTAEQLGIHGKALQDLAACALLHDNALTQYIHEELHGDTFSAGCLPPTASPCDALHAWRRKCIPIAFSYRCEECYSLPPRKCRWQWAFWKDMDRSAFGCSYHPSV